MIGYLKTSFNPKPEPLNDKGKKINIVRPKNIPFV